ncbi:2-Hydroxyacid oxidase 1 [Atheta coriaria]|uniref:2-Hydroxyacid oxidase 1 n=1 Tax=Dalotia coriaria TaxID=877792 RepID=UPI0031F39BC7
MDLVCVDDFEVHARNILPKNALDYYKSGAGQETTLDNNRKAFSKLRLRPRCLTNVNSRDLTTTILGRKIAIPVGISPTAMQRMAHADGELANVKAAEKHNTVFILSTIATSSIEEVAAAAPHAIKWFQLYIYNDREVTLGLIKRAEQAGFKALVLTVDTPFFGIRYADMRNKFTLPPHLKLANFQGEKASKINETKDGISGLNNYVNGLFDASLTWKDVEWLMRVTKLPIVLKGILTKEDANMACDLGVAGIIVSNHGARQVDGTPASIEALPEIITEVEKSGKNVEVYLDGGIRDGTDVFKALALGAKMVFMGRPALWGLAHSGQKGVERILDILKMEFDSTMAVCGCSSAADITKDKITHESTYSKL